MSIVISLYQMTTGQYIKNNTYMVLSVRSPIFNYSSVSGIVYITLYTLFYTFQQSPKGELKPNFAISGLFSDPKHIECPIATVNEKQISQIGVCTSNESSELT